MKTKTIYEEKILKEMQNLPKHLQEKLAKIVHFFKNEIIQLEPDEKKATEKFLSVCGTWEDERTPEEQIKNIYSQRKSRQIKKDMF